jgi:transketolase
VKAFFAERQKAQEADHAAWGKTYAAWQKANPKLAEELGVSRASAWTVASDQKAKTPDTAALFATIPEFPKDSKVATRKAGQDVLQPLAKAVPLLIGGSADLTARPELHRRFWAGDDDFARPSQGRNIASSASTQCAVMNGIAAHGIFRPSGATFLVFADYSRPAIRLAALSHLPAIYVFTHDSVGVGEDGPTHQPVETIPGLRVIPNLDVIRPADPEETAGAWVAALEHTHGPTLLALTSQAVPLLDSIPVKTRREGALKGGYIPERDCSFDTILLASGSEHALAAADKLGAGTRV